MNEEVESKPFEDFLADLRKILPHLYDPLDVHNISLTTLFGVRDSAHPIIALRQILIDAIRALEPAPDVPVHSNAWRIYHILRYRYVEQSAQWTVANNMGLSVRQLRRQERDAEKALASYLWTRHNLQRRIEAALSPDALPEEVGPAQNAGLDPAQNAGTGPAQNAGSDARERELEWVRDSFPSEVTDISALIQAILKTVNPLTRALNVQVDCEIPEDLPPVTGQRVLLRQSFLSLLTAAVQATPGGRVRISAEQQAEGIAIRLEAVSGTSASIEETGAEHVQMARECIGLFGGELEIEEPQTLDIGTGDTQTGSGSFVTALFLPVTEPLSVLVVDDNLDTLHLFQRYLSGTRYRFVGIEDPASTLSVAASLLPSIIVLDVMLPGLDGWELLGRLREHPATRNLPIIICTVMPQEQLALALGAAAYLRKPVSREVLLSALDRLVNSQTTRSG
jgi:CheY-like chemotaxis protein